MSVALVRGREGVRAIVTVWRRVVLCLPNCASLSLLAEAVRAVLMRVKESDLPLNNSEGIEGV